MEENAHSDSRKLTFGEHLEELRESLVMSVISIVVAVVICFTFSDQLFAFILRPIWRLAEEQHFTLILLEPAESFFVTMQVATITGIVLAAPFVFYFLWQFVAEGLYSHEKRYVVLFGPVTGLLFMVGVLFMYFVILPTGLRFLFEFIKLPILKPSPSLSSYINFFMILSLLMGGVFEVPVVLIALQKMGIVAPSTLADFRRHAWLSGLILSAVITPTGDVVTLALVTGPLLFLYEISIWVGRLMERRKRDREARESRSESEAGGS